MILGQYVGPNYGYQNTQYQENGPAAGPFVQENQQEQQPQNQGTIVIFTSVD